mmetsp:Transcript_11507/g.26676  ORF Transcript_11507/g.26676 Transcript_11507/m.26676 type:complete len:217 (-) Transcript_11507:161-811(-)
MRLASRLSLQSFFSAHCYKLLQGAIHPHPGHHRLSVDWMGIICCRAGGAVSPAACSLAAPSMHGQRGMSRVGRQLHRRSRSYLQTRCLLCRAQERQRNSVVLLIVHLSRCLLWARHSLCQQAPPKKIASHQLSLSAATDPGLPGLPQQSRTQLCTSSCASPFPPRPRASLHPALPARVRVAVPHPDRRFESEDLGSCYSAAPPTPGPEISPCDAAS